MQLRAWKTVGLLTCWETRGKIEFPNVKFTILDYQISIWLSKPGKPYPYALQITKAAYLSIALKLEAECLHGGYYSQSFVNPFPQPLLSFRFAFVRFIMPPKYRSIALARGKRMPKKICALSFRQIAGKKATGGFAPCSLSSENRPRARKKVDALLWYLRAQDFFGLWIDLPWFLWAYAMFLRRPSLCWQLYFCTFHHHKPHHAPAPAWTLSFEQHQIFYTRVRIRKCTYMPCKYFIDRHDKPVFNVIGACFKKPKYLVYLLSIQCLIHFSRP